MRQHTLSVEVIAETYRDFPAMLDGLKEAGDWYAVKDLIGRYMEVLDWHQDANDPTTGTVEIMLFEQAQAPDVTVQKITLTPRWSTLVRQGVTNGSVTKP